MQTTKNYKFKKPELTDSPPDITVMNFNWDTIDEKLFAVIQAWENFKANGGEIGGIITTAETHYKSESNISYKLQMLDNGFYVLSRFINGVFSENVMRFDTNNTNINGHIIPFNSGRSIGLPDARWKDLYLINSPNVSSKRELKDNIKIYDENLAYQTLKTLPIYTYNFKKFNDEGEQIGIEAENMLGCLLDEMPIECINEEAEGIDLYAYTSYVASALKVAIKKIEELEKTISGIKKV